MKIQSGLTAGHGRTPESIILKHLTVF